MPQTWKVLQYVQQVGTTIQKLETLGILIAMTMKMHSVTSTIIPTRNQRKGFAAPRVAPPQVIVLQQLLSLQHHHPVLLGITQTGRGLQHTHRGLHGIQLRACLHPHHHDPRGRQQLLRRPFATSRTDTCGGCGLSQKNLECPFSLFDTVITSWLLVCVSSKKELVVLT
jgi:hypothetical protein